MTDGVTGQPAHHDPVFGLRVEGLARHRRKFRYDDHTAVEKAGEGFDFKSRAVCAVLLHLLQVGGPITLCIRRDRVEPIMKRRVMISVFLEMLNDAGPQFASRQTDRRFGPPRWPTEGLGPAY